MATLSWEDMPIHQAIKADWETPELLIEGSLNCAKTTVALDKEVDAVLRYPGIPILLFRWTEDALSTKLRPPFEAILNIRKIPFEWDAKQKCYAFENGSVVYAFGLKAVSAVEMFNKIRGLGVHRIMGDQVEEMNRGVADELRARLRPDLMATLSGVKFPFQLTFVANPSSEEFWLSRQFPEDNHIKGRRLYSLSIFDNKHLPQASVDSLLRTYEPEHPKFRTMVLGKRGLNVVGDPVFDAIYQRAIHVRALKPDYSGTFLEAFEIGKHNPAYVLAQRTPSGALWLLGGVLGKGLVVEDFLPLVKKYRTEWLPDVKPTQIRSCISPMGDKATQTTARFTLLRVLQQAGFKLQWHDNGNAGDVRLAMIELLAGMLRRRTPAQEESIGVQADESRWIVATREGARETPFVAHAFEGGYVWDDHYRSVSNKEIRRPHEDDEYANAMHAVENLILNFLAGQETEETRAAKRAKAYENASGGSSYSPHSWLGF